MKTVIGWITMTVGKIVNHINIGQTPSMSQWIVFAAVLSFIFSLLTINKPLFASESMDEYCAYYVKDIIRNSNLNPSQRAIDKAWGLCLDHKWSEAKKVLLKSPQKLKGRPVRNIKGRCLDVAGGVNANRTNVQIFECNGTKSQKWTFTNNREIRNVMGRCLDVAGGVNANRTNVQIFECNGTDSQRWM